MLSAFPRRRGFPATIPALAKSKPYDPAAARALLDQFGYRDRDGDGYREMPDGKPFTIVRASKATVSAAPRKKANGSRSVWLVRNFIVPPYTSLL